MTSTTNTANTAGTNTTGAGSFTLQLQEEVKLRRRRPDVTTSDSLPQDRLRISPPSMVVYERNVRLLQEQGVVLPHVDMQAEGAPKIISDADIDWNVDLGHLKFYDVAAGTFALEQVRQFLSQPVRAQIVYRNVSPLGHLTNMRMLNAVQAFLDGSEGLRGNFSTEMPSNEREAEFLIVYGIGLGLHIPMLVDTLPIRRIKLVEPEPSLLHLALQMINVEALLEELKRRDGGLEIFCHPDPVELLGTFKHSFNNVHNAHDGSYVYQHYQSPILNEIVDNVGRHFGGLAHPRGFFEDEVIMLRNVTANLSKNPNPLPLEGVPPLEEVPSLEGVPPLEKVPSLEGSPPLEKVPPLEGSPPLEKVPPLEEVPPLEGSPPFERAPPSSSQKSSSSSSSPTPARPAQDRTLLPALYFDGRSVLNVRQQGAVVVVGAGPSLDSGMEFLRDLGECAVIISAGTALRAILAAGIRPDFHVELENTPQQYDILRRTHDEFGFDGIPFLAATCVDPRIPPLFKQTVFFMRDHLSPSILFNAYEPTYMVAPSVSNAALRLACAFAGRTVVLMGVDLGARLNAQHHAAQSAYYAMHDLLGKSAAHQAATKYDIEVAANFGGIAYTNNIFLLAQEHIELVAASMIPEGMSVMNASDGMAMSHTIPCLPSRLVRVVKERGTSVVERKRLLSAFYETLVPLKILSEDADHYRNLLHMLEQHAFQVLDTIHKELSWVETDWRQWDAVRVQAFRLLDAPTSDPKVGRLIRQLYSGVLASTFAFTIPVLRRLPNDDTRARFVAAQKPVILDVWSTIRTQSADLLTQMREMLSVQDAQSPQHPQNTNVRGRSFEPRADEKGKKATEKRP